MYHQAGFILYPFQTIIIVAVSTLIFGRSKATLSLAPTGHNVIAQGNALGLRGLKARALKGRKLLLKLKKSMAWHILRPFRAY